MFVAAWRIRVTEEECEACGGIGRVRTNGNGVTFRGPIGSRLSPYCAVCDGGGTHCVANAARAEALRLLAECGKVGEPGFGYDDVLGHESDSPCVVASHWWYGSNLGVACPGWADPVSERLALLDVADVQPELLAVAELAHESFLLGARAAEEVVEVDYGDGLIRVLHREPFLYPP
jgi:hypothetical protein